MSSIPSLKKEFVRALQDISHRHQTRTVFSDWLEIAAITLHQLPYNSEELPKDKSFEAVEAQYFQAIKPYDRETLGIMATMLGMTTAAYQQEFGDFLGEIASEQEFLNARVGQFFTPYEVCRAMAKMTLHDAKSLVEKKGLITIDEPASGGGAMIIACAEELVNQGLDPRSCAQFQATDVSRDAFNMTYIQLSALSLQALVRHGNTLSNEMWESRPTFQLRYFQEWLRENQTMAKFARLKALLTDPDPFFSEETDEEKTTQPEGNKADMVQTPDNAPSESTASGQLSLFDLDASSTPAPKKRKRSPRQSDVTLPPPEQRQLDLFSRNNQME